MTYNIKIKGDNDLLQIEDRGDLLKNKWEDYLKSKKDEAVTINGWTGKLSDISWFRLMKDARSDSESGKLTHEQYLAERNETLKMSPAERAKRLGYFRVVYFGFTGKKSEEVKTNTGIPIEELAIKIQEKFFTENPTRIFCDAELFRPIIKSGECTKSVEGIIKNQTLQEYFAVKNL